MDEIFRPGGNSIIEEAENERNQH